MASVADEQTRALNALKRVQYIIEENYDEINPSPAFDPPTNLIVMVGGADFFRKNRSFLRYDPYELIALVNYLKGIGADTLDTISHVLAFDSAYTDETIQNDVEIVNRIIYADRKGDELNDWGGGMYAMGNVLFHFIPFNLPTQYKEVSRVYYPFLNGESPVTRLADQCTPQEGSLMKALQNLCIRANATNYYLYNCAWIRGNTSYVQSNDNILLFNGKMNRHYELMCELLNIMLSLGKPAYLLTAKDMSVFTHARKTIGSVEQLNITPLNRTTLFKKEEWQKGKPLTAREKLRFVKEDAEGGGKNRRSTRRRKSTKAHKSRKQR